MNHRHLCLDCGTEWSHSTEDCCIEDYYCHKHKHWRIKK